MLCAALISCLSNLSLKSLVFLSYQLIRFNWLLGSIKLVNLLLIQELIGRFQATISNELHELSVLFMKHHLLLPEISTNLFVLLAHTLLIHYVLTVSFYNLSHKFHVALLFSTLKHVCALEFLCHLRLQCAWKQAALLPHTYFNFCRVGELVF